MSITSVWSLGSSYPALLKKLRLKFINEEVSNFFLTTLKETIKFREDNKIKRNDFLQLLIQLKNKGQVEDENGDIIEEGTITLNEACAQAFVFFLGGSDTSATAMNFCLFELAVNLDIQEKLREEVMSTLNASGGKLDYEGMMSMKYMDMVINGKLF